MGKSIKNNNEKLAKKKLGFFRILSRIALILLFYSARCLCSDSMLELRMISYWVLDRFYFSYLLSFAILPMHTMPEFMLPLTLSFLIMS